MKKARRRALTLDERPCAVRLCAGVEMKKARHRALTPVFALTSTAQVAVEMKKARHRALTQVEKIVHEAAETSRNEKSPLYNCVPS